MGTLPVLEPVLGPVLKPVLDTALKSGEEPVSGCPASAALSPWETAKSHSAEELQASWAARPIAERLKVLGRARHLLAEQADTLADCISPALHRTKADTLAAEVLPLLDALQFLERSAARILQTRRLGRKGRPLWLAGTESSVERVAMGRVLVIGPGNYPLFLPGVQTMQALAAGNLVVWKPGRGGAAVAQAVQSILQAAGLPDGLLRVTGESTEEGLREITGGVDLVILTGSAEAGRAVLHACADRLTPVIAELSGCDACFVLPGADAERVSAALAFGMRLNGSATCMAPRRLILAGQHADLLERVRVQLQQVPPVTLPETTRNALQDALREATEQGAQVAPGVLAELASGSIRPILVQRARPEMRLLQMDLFAPVLSVVEVADVEAALAAGQQGPFGLTAAIFGPERMARDLGKRLPVGTVLVNDLIVSTADPRVPFGGRRGSGFGVTRGAEGLLAVTAPRTLLVRHGKGTRQYQSTGEEHAGLFRGMIGMLHGRNWSGRLTAVQQITAAAMRLK